jgi:hypothetical protein
MIIDQLAAAFASMFSIPLAVATVLAWMLVIAVCAVACRTLCRAVLATPRRRPVSLDAAEERHWQARAARLQAELDAAKRELGAAGDWRARAHQLEQDMVWDGRVGGLRPAGPGEVPGRAPLPPPSDRTEPRPCRHTEIQPVISGGRIRRFVCGNPRCDAQWPPDAMIYEPGDGDEPVTEQW